MLKYIKNGQLHIGSFNISWSISKRPKNILISNTTDFSNPPYKLHLGPGPNWVKPSEKWLTVDIDPNRGDIVIDFHEFESFPLESNSVESIYASHTLEHISMYRIGRVISECYRVLQKGGILRVIVPNPRVSIQQYLDNNIDFPLFARRRERSKRVAGYDLTIFECLKADFISVNLQPDLLGEKLAHQNAWDFDSMRAELTRSGFDSNNIHQVAFQQIGSDDFSFEGKYPSEANEYDRSLYVEAIK
jgi:predicted SAM-dependent methyltransferase